jgi:hypothetical protein
VEHHEKLPPTIQFRSSNTGKYVYIMYYGFGWADSFHTRDHKKYAK